MEGRKPASPRDFLLPLSSGAGARPGALTPEAPRPPLRSHLTPHGTGWWPGPARGGLEPLLVLSLPFGGAATETLPDPPAAVRPPQGNQQGGLGSERLRSSVHLPKQPDDSIAVTVTGRRRGCRSPCSRPWRTAEAAWSSRGSRCLCSPLPRGTPRPSAHWAARSCPETGEAFPTAEAPP